MTVMPMAATWMDVEEAAVYAAVPAQAIRDAIDSRELQAVTWHPMRPGTWLVHARDVERWAAGA